ncbi:MAG: hypothetical protein GX952_07110 [Firmicutes bacterium]|nr:hypothetical protein [Bacillota bacterium]
MLELQLMIIGWMLVSGILLGFVFDVWRACRAILHPGRLASSLGDLIFWLLATVTLAAVLLISTYGDVRGGYLLCSAAGFMVQQRLISDHIQQSLQQVLRVLFRWLVRLATWLGLPVWLPLKFVFQQGKAVNKKRKMVGRALKRLIKRKLALFSRKRH